MCMCVCLSEMVALLTQQVSLNVKSHMRKSHSNSTKKHMNSNSGEVWISRYTQTDIHIYTYQVTYLNEGILR